MTTNSGTILLYINVLFLMLSPISTISYALPTIPLAILAGYQLYLKQKAQPDYRKEYEEKLVMYQNQFVKQIAERDEFYIAEIKRISEELTRMNVTQLSPTKTAKPTYKF